MYGYGRKADRWRLPLRSVLWIPLSLLIIGIAQASERSDYDQAWQFFQQGRYTEAIAGFKSYLSKYPKGTLAAEARFTLARIEPSGHNAFVHYQFIVDNFPNHPLASQASYATAQYYQNIGTMAEAKARYLATYTRYGQTPAGSESLYRLALLAVHSDSLEKAEVYARTFAEQYPASSRNPAILAALSERYQALGDTSRSRANWRAILANYPTSYEAGEARERLLSEVEEEATADSALSQLPVPVPELKTAVPQRDFFYLQVGAYRDRTVLARWESRLKSRGFKTLVDSSDLASKGVWRLRLGPYYTRQEAAAESRKLKTAEGLEAMIVEVR